MINSLSMRVWGALTDEQRNIIRSFQAEPPVKVGALAKEFGVVVKKATLKPGISGEIKKENEGFVIRVNRHDVVARQRFTLAHEIAHFLLHQDYIGDGLEDDMLYRSRLSNPLEMEANSLAAEILMPKHLLDSLKEKYLDIASKDLRLEKMAKELEVSTDALSYRG